MVLFCPTCGNILLIEDVGGLHRFYCQTCPYIFPITAKVASTLSLPRKKVDDVMGEEAAWANAAREAGACVGAHSNLIFPSDMPKVHARRGLFPASTPFFLPVLCENNTCSYNYVPRMSR